MIRLCPEIEARPIMEQLLLSAGKTVPAEVRDAAACEFKPAPFEHWHYRKPCRVVQCVCLHCAGRIIRSDLIFPCQSLAHVKGKTTADMAGSEPSGQVAEKLPMVVLLREEALVKINGEDERVLVWIGQCRTCSKVWYYVARRGP